MIYESGTAIIYAEDIDLKIEEYQREDELEDWQQYELQEMILFRENAKNTIYSWEKRTSFILQSYFPVWAEGEAGDVYGKEVVDSGYFNISQYTEDRGEDFSEISYGSDVYLADGG